MSNNYSKNYIENEYKQIFNEEISIDKVTGTCPKISYNNNSISKLDCTCDTKSGVVTKFIKSIKEDKSVELYYKIAFYSSKRYLGNETRVLSKDASENEIIDSRVLKDDVKEIDYQSYLDSNYNDFYTYVYKFRKKGNNYYFYSINKQN